MYKLVVFDWDGTILDSTNKIVSCMQMAFQDNDLNTPSDQQAKNIIGLGLPEAIKRLQPGLNLQQVVGVRESYSKFFLEADQSPCAYYPNVEEGLIRLKNADYLLAVATGKSRRGLSRVLNALNMNDFFHTSRCADETESKPSPLMLHEIMQELEVEPENTLMVGDTEYDLEMATRANVNSVAVSYGAHSVERLMKHQPEKCIDHFDQLVNLLLNNQHGTTND